MTLSHSETLVKSLSNSTVAIVGLGLMGGSLALALRKKKACRKIISVTRNTGVRERAIAERILDDASPDLALVSEADLIVLAAPVRTIIDQLPRVGAIARQGAIIMDLGSTKREIVRTMEQLPEHLQPIGGHPMCGKEVSGFASSDAKLYDQAVFVLTPLARTSRETTAFGLSLIGSLNARPLILDAERHDKIVAVTSHLPFAVAVALMLTADEFARDDDLLFELAASGLRDTSRLAASDTDMMLDILLTNHANIANALRAYSRHFSELAKLIEKRDEKELRGALRTAAEKRSNLLIGKM